jgi:signal transduction histidine kinase
MHISLLLVESSEADARVVIRQLEQSGYEVNATRVETRAEVEQALAGRQFDVVVSDDQLPLLDAPSLLGLLEERGVDAPCVIVSRAVGDERAADVMHAGARDVVTMDSLWRLGPVIARELQRAAENRERACAEEALRQTERGLRMALERIPDGVVVHEEGRIVHANAAAASLLGVGSVDELLGRSFVTAPSSTEPQQPTTWNGRPATLALLRDMTLHRDLVAKMVAADRVGTLGTLAAGVGHEINNPLASILANVEFLMEDLATLQRELVSQGEVDERIQRIAQSREILAEIGEGGRRIRDIVADLQTLSRTSEDIGPVDVTTILDTSLRVTAAETKRRARIVREFEQVRRVRGNASQLAQVFVNLILNAAQAIEEGAPTRNEIRVRVLGAASHVAVEVHDTGSGIPEGVLRDIFTPFFTTKPVGQGTGLGLAICQRAVHSLGGEIEVESEVGRGSCFRVLLPVAEPPA